MKSLGIVRKIDGLGRIVLPIELRHGMNIGEGDALELFTEEDRIILRKYEPSCIFCKNSKNIVNYHGHNVCETCIENLKKLPATEAPSL